MTKSQQEYTGKTCIVTGGAGFVGSFLCAKLASLGANVISIDKEDFNHGSLFNLINKNNKVNSLTLDLSASSSVNSVGELNPEFIFHLCGTPYAPYTSMQPVTAFRSNVLSTINMLEVARTTLVDRFVLASSACVFGATTESPLRVDGECCKPEHYYTYTKRQAEDATKSYNEFYGVPVSVCRFVNIYGPGDRHFGRLIPALCKQLTESISDELTLFRSSGDSVFEFLYVDDAVSGLLDSARHGSDGYGIYHFGPGDMGRSKTMDVASKLSFLYDNKRRKLTTKSTGGEKTVEKYLDIQDTIDKIGWQPHWKLDDGLLETVSWYEKNIIKLVPFEYPS